METDKGDGQKLGSVAVFLLRCDVSPLFSVGCDRSGEKNSVVEITLSTLLFHRRSLPLSSVSC